MWELGQLLAVTTWCFYTLLSLWLNRGGLWGAWDSGPEDKFCPGPTSSLEPLDLLISESQGHYGISWAGGEQRRSPALANIPGEHVS